MMKLYTLPQPHVAAIQQAKYPPRLAREKKLQEVAEWRPCAPVSAPQAGATGRSCC